MSRTTRLMKIHRVLSFLFLGCVLEGAIGQAQETVSRAIPNWPAPAFWNPAEALRAAREGVHPLQVQAILPGAFPFVPVTPCRQFDSRTTTALADNTNLTIVLSGAPCGIPTTAAAVSVNITVFAISGAAGNGVFRLGIANDPPTAWINYPPTETQRANAGTVATDGSGNIVVKVNQGGGSIQLVVDVNGYYPASDNVYLGPNAGIHTAGGLGPGIRNTGIGQEVLFDNITGNDNTAVGSLAARATTGDLNTAIGRVALINNTTGSGNIAVGVGAGANLTTGSNNIDIGNGGVAGESNIIRIGTAQAQTFIAGISNVPVGNVETVMVTAQGQLGTVFSSARFKEQIRDMGEASSGLLKLRPVTFHYKGQAEGSNPLHFGLIAEEVEEMLPELVGHAPTGEAQTVHYYEMPAMLLNELQKQHQTIEEQRKLITVLEARLAALEEQFRERKLADKE